MADSGTRDRGGRYAFTQFARWVLGIGYERNVGGTERTIRYILGGLCVLAGIGVVTVPVPGNPLVTAGLAVVLLIGGAYLIYEARVQYCPLNHTLDRNTHTKR